MANLLNPPAIIFINQNLHPFVQGMVERQLYITKTMTAKEFDLRTDGYADGYSDGYSDGYYTEAVRGRDERILVLRDLHDQTNRSLADIVLCWDNGLLYAEINKVGPVGQAFTLDHASLLDFRLRFR